MRIWIVVILLAFTQASVFTREDQVCDPTRANKVLPYTGFRLHRQYTHGRLPMLHHQRLTHCHSGAVDQEAVNVVDRNTDIQWAVNMCVNNQLCYRAVRKKKYAQRNLSLYVPHTVVGGLFQCPAQENCTNDNAWPLFPLIADHTSEQFFEYPKLSRIVQRVPYFYTPNVINRHYPLHPEESRKWARKLDINEDYTYTKWERVQIARTVSKMLNTVHRALMLDPKLMPWERDRVVMTLDRDFKQPRKSVDVFSWLQPVLKQLAPQVLDEVIKQLQTPVDELELDTPDINHLNDHERKNNNSSMPPTEHDPVELDDDPLHEEYKPRVLHHRPFDENDFIDDD